MRFRMSSKILIFFIATSTFRKYFPLNTVPNVSSPAGAAGAGAVGWGGGGPVVAAAC